METDPKGKDLVSKIALDVKALTLLYGTDEALRTLLKRDIIESRDEGMKRFVRLLQTGEGSRMKGAIPVAVAN